MNHNNANRIYLNIWAPCRFYDQVYLIWGFERDVGESDGQMGAVLGWLVNNRDSCGFLNSRNQFTRLTERLELQLGGRWETDCPYKPKTITFVI